MTRFPGHGTLPRKRSVGRWISVAVAAGFLLAPVTALASTVPPDVPPDLTSPPDSSEPASTAPVSSEPTVTTEPVEPTEPAVVDVTISPSEIGHEPTVLDWQSYPETSTVTNNGAEVTITAVSVEGPFTVDAVNCIGTTLATGGTCTLETIYYNRDNGTIEGRLTVTLSTGDTVSAALRGGILYQSRNPWGSDRVGLGDFGFGLGTVVLGISQPSVFGLTNAFSSNMIVGLFTASPFSAFGGFAGASRPLVVLTEGDFSVDTGDCDGAVLAPGESCTVSVTFRPTRVGTSAVQLSVETNLGTFATALTAEGVATPPAILPATR